ncbi:transglutaminase domain-containing protein [uncultured Polaribacter sp.]|uniref:transglutaminase domain-containing protein n=1 Tax=uncultured Polaribacter sp. TaxID=174711 RepID=UPI00261E9711|nr:transglutaminase domain-containing protein [uncultured Polaribacter sp.]
MKPFLLLFLLVSIAVNSQEFAKVDQLVLNYPKFSNVANLASKIKKDFSTDKDKARAAFIWLANNINYDLEEYYNPKQRTYSFKYRNEAEKLEKIQLAKDQIINTAFKTKKGVCEEYAQAFKKICDLLQIEAAVISGNVRNSASEIGIIKNTTNHAWNAVKIDHQWIFLDATWAAGFLRNNKWIKSYNNYFYNIPKENIFKTHLPKKSIWILRFGRITPKEFYNQPIYKEVFLDSKATLLNPKQGIISPDKENKIVLKFKNLNATTRIIYNFKGNRIAKKPLKTTTGKTTIITIPNAKRNTELNIFMNGTIAMQYKVH